MTAAEYLHERTALILAIRDLDSRLLDVLNQAGTYRASEEARQLLLIRGDLVAKLEQFDGAPPCLPDVLGL